ncbi:Sodium channel protein 60E [Ooceraea biroi]|uniref:Sodium channel protein 60E n=1 Tax=Ooceraea biroi TaxID=2015173 RepID=A0A026X4I7_OOCBI|nr:Sodium channel protein 60E [Ooceraea biroi]
MTSRRGGSDGYKSPPSPPSSGSEDGFTNRPRVAGLYIKNLSREELDELAKEGIYGPTGNPNDRPRDGGSQRSLNLPGSSRDPDQDRAARAPTSRTPQPPRRSGIGTRHRELTAGLPVEDLARRDHYGSLPTDRGWPRRPEDRPGQPSPERTGVRGSSESLAGRREPSARLGADVGSPRGSSIDVRNIGEDSRQPHRLAEVPRRPPPPPPRVPPSTSGVDENQGMSGPVGRPPPSYAGLSPPEYSKHEEPQVSKIRPKVVTRTYQVDDEKPGPDTPYERPSSPLPGDSKNPQATPKSTEPRDDTGKAEELSSPSQIPVTDKPTSPATTKRIGSKRVQDSTRLRPPLAGTVGTSADSGTGDSGSAEIQADIVTPQTASGDILDLSNVSKSNGGKSPGSRTPGSKGGKQTVKPFTKESLEKLENKTVQLVREYGFQPKRKMSVEDGAVLPNKFEPFPDNLYGRPLEEIDNFIYDEGGQKGLETAGGVHERESEREEKRAPERRRRVGGERSARDEKSEVSREEEPPDHPERTPVRKERGNGEKGDVRKET